MAHPKVASIISRRNRQPKAKSNRIAEVVRSVDSGFFTLPEPSNVAFTLQYAMRVLSDCHTDPHPEPVSLELDDCPVCYAMRLCAAELITLKSHATDTLDRIGGAL
jgi:hypothetical protein